MISIIHPQIYGFVAQLVVQWIVYPKVESSNLFEVASITAAVGTDKRFESLTASTHIARQEKVRKFRRQVAYTMGAVRLCIRATIILCQISSVA